MGLPQPDSYRKQDCPRVPRGGRCQRPSPDALFSSRTQAACPWVAGVGPSAATGNPGIAQDYFAHVLTAWLKFRGFARPLAPTTATHCRPCSDTQP